MKRRHNFLKLSLLFLILLGFWLILASNLSVQSILVGSIVSLSVVMYNSKIAIDPQKPFRFSMKTIFVFIKYIIKLIIDIFKANIDVALIVLNPKMPISPSVVTINTKLKSDLLKVIFSNSITLTPGTLTLVNDKQKITIHCLTEAAMEGVSNWDMENLIAKFEED